MKKLIAIVITLIFIFESAGYGLPDTCKASLRIPMKFGSAQDVDYKDLLEQVYSFSPDLQRISISAEELWNRIKRFESETGLKFKPVFVRPLSSKNQSWEFFIGRVKAINAELKDMGVDRQDRQLLFERFHNNMLRTGSAASFGAITICVKDIEDSFNLYNQEFKDRAVSIFRQKVVPAAIISHDGNIKRAAGILKMVWESAKDLKPRQIPYFFEIVAESKLEGTLADIKNTTRDIINLIKFQPVIEWLSERVESLFPTPDSKERYLRQARSEFVDYLVPTLLSEYDDDFDMIEGIARSVIKEAEEIGPQHIAAFFRQKADSLRNLNHIRKELHTDIGLAVRGLKAFNVFIDRLPEPLKNKIKRLVWLKTVYAGIAPQNNVSFNSLVNSLSNSHDRDILFDAITANENFIIVNHGQGRSLVNIEAASNVIRKNMEVFPKEALEKDWLKNNHEEWSKAAHSDRYYLLSGLSRNAVDKHNLLNAVWKTLKKDNPELDKRGWAIFAKRITGLSAPMSGEERKKWAIFINEQMPGLLTYNQMDSMLDSFRVKNDIIQYQGFGLYDVLWAQELEKIFRKAERIIKAFGQEPGQGLEKPIEIPWNDLAAFIDSIDSWLSQKGVVILDAFVFGSRANGRQKKDSDLDIGLFIDKHITLDDYGKLKSLWRGQLKIDLLIYSYDDFKESLHQVHPEEYVNEELLEKMRQTVGSEAVDGLRIQIKALRSPVSRLLESTASEADKGL
ncbi:MAG: nucleotidyltransferase domain-containing protein [Candidatus Omnitrophica bacterium]|nr:nucleotidyltransferase domain-containing protein [Candidatus Omnitrophota bacterium]